MKRLVLWMILLLLAAVVVGCSSKNDRESKKKELSISAAASLTDALTELKNEFEKENDVTILLNLASSGKLATQIEQGAPTDIFLSASNDDMERLAEKGLIDESSVVDFAENSLVLIANKKVETPVSSFNQIDAQMIEHLSIGEPASVPVGKYTKEVLEQLDLWGSLHTKLVMGSDVRQVLTHVEMGNADYGIVYASDAWISNKVNVVAEADPSWHSPILYPGAVLKDSKYKTEAQVFLNFVSSEKGRTILQKYGFQ